MAETALRQAGFRLYRVRHHGVLARIEVAPEEIPLILNETLREQLVLAIKSAGFTFVTLDLAGYCTGSMHSAAAPVKN